VNTTEGMKKKRKLFDELVGFDALVDQRAGKRTLRTHAPKPKTVPEKDQVKIKGRLL
jgi:hypothetical protein